MCTVNNPHDQDCRHVHIWTKAFINFSGTGGLISTKLGMLHCGLKYFNVCINYDPVMTLTYFMARSINVAHDHNGQTSLLVNIPDHR